MLKADRHLSDLIWFFQCTESAHGLQACGLEPSATASVHDHEAQWRLMERVVDRGPHVRRWRRIATTIASIPRTHEWATTMSTAIKPWNVCVSLAAQATWKDLCVARLVLQMGAASFGESYDAFQIKAIRAAQAGGSRVLSECINATRRRLDACLSEYLTANGATEAADAWEGPSFALYGER